MSVLRSALSPFNFRKLTSVLSFSVAASCSGVLYFEAKAVELIRTYREKELLFLLSSMQIFEDKQEKQHLL